MLLYSWYFKLDLPLETQVTAVQIGFCFASPLPVNLFLHRTLANSCNGLLLGPAINATLVSISVMRFSMPIVL